MEQKNVSPVSSERGHTSPDLEKGPNAVDVSSRDSDGSAAPNVAEAHVPVPNTLRRWNEKIENLAGLEARGIKRVEPDERQEETLMGYVQMVLLWLSANITANNLAVGLFGPLVFDLGFTDSALCAVFGAFVGCLSTAYMSTWGAASGNRTMVS